MILLLQGKLKFIDEEIIIKSELIVDEESDEALFNNLTYDFYIKKLQELRKQNNLQLRKLTLEERKILKQAQDLFNRKFSGLFPLLKLKNIMDELTKIEELELPTKIKVQYRIILNRERLNLLSLTEEARGIFIKFSAHLESLPLLRKLNILRQNVRSTIKYKQSVKTKPI